MAIVHTDVTATKSNFKIFCQAIQHFNISPSSKNPEGLSPEHRSIPLDPELD
jgi:hypothetical protein